ncbi:hypothetical protein WK39_28025 [Burkholderia cepacia]|uniref:DUF4376 domain-containing protein n=1 Tax=Burkholderia cepacia TaxID=292 RepID=UPI000758CE28|nr:DUF4376 domain-containing protein [Burkholderia cepacia]KVS50711.1 hypothetical protein WK39_28025 [Burkholderia cepacia]KVS65737.1 hypothetical protein WK40_12335 [Burkholderia cepacia]
MTNLTTAYQCDAQGVLIGTTQVQEDPSDPGSVLLPPGVTMLAPPTFDPAQSIAVFANAAWSILPLKADTPPSSVPAASPAGATADNKPTVGANEVAVIVNGQWQVLPDFRGMTYWLTDGTQHDITEIGETLPAGALKSPPPPPAPAAPTLDQLRDQQGAMLQAAYLVATRQPVSLTTAAGVTQTFQADLRSQQTLQTAMQGYDMAGAVPDGFYWVAADNTQVPFTLADLKGLYAAMLAQGWTAFQRLQDRKAALAAAATAADVQAVGW